MPSWALCLGIVGGRQGLGGREVRAVSLGEEFVSCAG